MYIFGKPHTNFQLNLKLKAVLDAGCIRDLTMLRLYVHVYHVL